MDKNDLVEKNEIDLKELFHIMWDKKRFIVLFTLFLTLVSILYVFFKNPLPIYQGKVLVEIGEIQSETFGSSLLDNPNNLSQIIRAELNINSSLPKRTSNLIEINFKNSDKNLIKEKLNNTIEFVLQRHKKKVKFYKNYMMTKQIGNINIDDRPINQLKKKLIVTLSFVTAFILSIFIVFFMVFIKSFNISKDKND